MDPNRKRHIRLVVALSAAVLLAAGLVYTSFSASTEAKQPSELREADAGKTYDLTGKVVPGTIQRTDDHSWRWRAMNSGMSCTSSNTAWAGE